MPPTIEPPATAALTTAGGLPPARRSPLARRSLGIVIALAGACLLALEAVHRIVDGDPRVSGALLGGLMAAAATAMGTLPVLFSQRISQRVNDGLLGFGAGVMLAAASFSLVLPGLDAAAEQGHGPWMAGGLVGIGIVLGVVFVLAAGRSIPADLFKQADLASPALKRAWIFVMAIAVHNFPEGLAIGVAFAGDDPSQARALATGISIQDVPEGLVVALALRSAGYARSTAALIGACSGLIEPLAAVLGAAAISVTAGLLPWGLAFAAGAMLCAICHEVIPGSHEHGHATFATGGLTLGFVVMMMLDTALG